MAFTFDLTAYNIIRLFKLTGSIGGMCVEEPKTLMTGQIAVIGADPPAIRLKIKSTAGLRRDAKPFSAVG
ncbi:hypothetical protein [Rhizobium chutanense]|uniref:Uncharacterized protein n=1 Tax=Rhizobium chutanense TaxID=2035448 RepID=A0A3S0R3W1_9HYPH|nr:hypothetical protein [Rhizobium chutanense]RUM09323.1 hypothetical protein EFR84_02995 [Rhizobium chutanense]